MRACASVCVCLSVSLGEAFLLEGAFHSLLALWLWESGPVKSLDVPTCRAACPLGLVGLPRRVSVLVCEACSGQRTSIPKNQRLSHLLKARGWVGLSMEIFYFVVEVNSP